MKICINHINGFQIIEIADIIYCEPNSSYTLFQLKDGSQVISSKTLLEYKTLLNQDYFARIYRSFLITINHIKEYGKSDGGYVIMDNNVKLEVSRRKKEEFKHKMYKFYSVNI